MKQAIDGIWPNTTSSSTGAGRRKLFEEYLLTRSWSFSKSVVGSKTRKMVDNLPINAGVEESAELFVRWLFSVCF